MRLLAVLLSGLLVCGCIYDVPLTKEAVVPVDPALKGVWQLIPDEGESEDPDDRVMILPFSKTEYLAVVGADDDALYFRAYPICVSGMELLQLEWLRAGEDDHPYMVCRYTLKGGILTVGYLNNDLVSPDSKKSAALQEAVLANRSNPDLFEDSARYRRLKD